MVDASPQQFAAEGHAEPGPVDELGSQEHALRHDAGEPWDEAGGQAHGQGQGSHAVGDDEQGLSVNVVLDVGHGRRDVVQGHVVEGVAGCGLVVGQTATAAPVKHPWFVTVVQQDIDEVAGLGQDEHVR